MSYYMSLLWPVFALLFIVNTAAWFHYRRISPKFSRPNQCHACGYDLSGLGDRSCPECRSKPPERPACTPRSRSVLGTRWLASAVIAIVPGLVFTIKRELVADIAQAMPNSILPALLILPAMQAAALVLIVPRSRSVFALLGSSLMLSASAYLGELAWLAVGIELAYPSK